MKQDLKLEFKCPVAIESMPKCEGGYACTQCEKTVFDYSKMNLADFEGRAKQNKVISQCGIYKAYQIDDSYGDWRDKVTKAYRNTIRRSQAKKRYFALLPFLAGFLFIIGCGNRQVCGEFYDAGNHTNNQDTLKENNLKPIE